MGFKESVQFLLVTLVASVALVVLSIVYFGVTLWMIKVASSIFFGGGLEANWAVLSATLMSVGAVLAGAIQRKGSK